MRSTKRHAALPIGRTARMAFDIDVLRGECCQAAELLLAKEPLAEAELEECARLEESLQEAQRLLKATIRSIMLSRLNRRSRAK